MIVPSTIEKMHDGLASGPPRFQMEPPSTNPFVVNGGLSLTKTAKHFDLGWIEEKSSSVSVPTAEQICESVVSRARLDAADHPRSARAHTGLGLALLNRGLLDEALAEFELALQIAPNEYVALMNLARIHVAEGRMEAAVRIYTRLRDLRPSDPAPRLSMAFLAMVQGNYTRAAETLRGVLALDEESVLAHYMMAVACLHERQIAESISHLKRATRVEVRLPALHHALGVAYSVKGDVRRAIRSFKTALALAPGMPDAVLGLANSYVRLRNTQGVIDLLQEFLETNPDNLEARELLARAFTEDKNFASARVQFVRLHDQLRTGARSSRHELGRALNNIGVCYEHLGQPNFAEQYFQRALQESAADDALPYHNLALVYFKTRRRNEALQLLRSTKERFPDSQRGRLLLSRCCRELGLIDEAVDELRSLVARPDALQDAFIDLGSVLTEMKRDFAGGISVSEEGLLRFPKNPTLVNNLAYAHLMGGDPVSAWNVLSRFPRSKWPRGTQDEVVLTATLGLLRLYEGKFGEGENLYSEAARLASSLGDKALYTRVQQKKYLELGRAYLRSAQYEAALRQARLGLNVREGFPSYTEDLEALVVQVHGLRAQGSLF